ncbi:MAG: DUF3047 domain-containing protein [Rhodospirillaceae bacterium]|nr:DUF3047 domain-containing protein [Rhodospirillaceae bacterium]
MALLALLGQASISVATTDSAIPADLARHGWEAITFDGKRANTFQRCGEDCIAVETETSVSMIGRPVMTDLANMPVLSWEWKIDLPVVPSDLSSKGEDDRAVALYVTFPYDPEKASFSENLMRPVVELARGSDAPGRVISYVWGGFGERGQVVESPYFGGLNAMIVSRTQAAPVGEWVAERFDIIADHERVFGWTPKSAQHILISADSDDTQADNRAYVRKIVFGTR